jgi:hypothetical protein
VFGDRGIKRAIGITSFLALFFNSSNISIPSFYLAMITHPWILVLCFFGRFQFSDIATNKVPIENLYEPGGNFSVLIVCMDVITQKEI